MGELKLKAAAYARYSTDNQTKNSIAYQMEKIQEYCKENNITLCAFYSDEGESGTNMDRPGFRNLEAAARRREFDAVVIYDISRGSRDVGDWFSFRKTMLRHGVQVISCTQQLGDFTNSNDFLVELLSVGLGHREVLETRQKSMDGVAAKAKQGVFLGGTPPLGYDVVNGNYAINPTEAQIVKKIFALYADGYSYNKIIAKLNGAKGKRGRPIGKNSLNSILSNERYIGVYTWNKRKVKLFRQWAGGELNPNCVRIENCIPRIIDNETWGRVRKRMSENKRNGQYKAVRREYLLSGLIECGRCGAAYVGRTSKNTKGYETSYYVCGNKYRTKDCDAHNISANEIEAFVVTHLKQYLLEIDFEAKAREIAGAINGTSADLSAEKRELNDIITKINNGVKAIISGMNFPELQDEIDRLRVRKDELEDIIASSQRNHSYVEPERIAAIFEGAVENWNDENIRRIVQTFVTKIYANPDGTFSVNIGVHSNGCGRGI